METRENLDWPADRVERMAVADLIAYPKNARTHSPEQVDEIAASIAEWGFTIPVLVDEAMTVIAGHGRLLAAAKLGLEAVPVMVARGWSPAQVKAYRIADNQLALNSGWDVKLLAAELGELPGLEALLGFSDDALAALGLVEPVVEDDAKANELPPPTEERVTVAGDLWRCGDHRVICGDCRDAAVIARLVDGRAINVGFTSPPYAEQRDYDPASGFRPIAPDDYVAWFAPVAANIARHLAPDGSWFVNIKPAAAGLDTSLYVMDLVIAHVRSWGWHFATEFCWERIGVPKRVRARFKNQFEPIYQFARDKWKMRPDAVRHYSPNVPRAGGPGSGQTTWKHGQGTTGGIAASFGGAKKRKHGATGPMEKMQGSADYAPGDFISPGLAYPGNRLPVFQSEALNHAAAFPVGLPEFFIKAYSDPGDRVLDPFLGTGSTLIAAERCGAIGLGAELSPLYVDITVRRWQAFTGQQAILDGDGRTFEEIAAQRRPAADG